MKKQTGMESSGEKPTPKKGVKRGHTTKELRTKHLRDKNHSISDEDIKSIRVEMKSDEEVPTKLPEGDERPHDVDKDKRFKTSWDVLGEP